VLGRGVRDLCRHPLVPSMEKMFTIS
jgi:hypothetical protein